MKKALIIAGAIAGVSLLARRVARTCGHGSCRKTIERTQSEHGPAVDTGEKAAA
jgi:hypothetical protein